jgi:hypothetical protein
MVWTDNEGVQWLDGYDGWTGTMVWTDNEGVQWLDGYNDWVGTMVGRVRWSGRTNEGVQWLDGYNDWMGTMVRTDNDWGYSGWMGTMIGWGTMVGRVRLYRSNYRTSLIVPI